MLGCAIAGFSFIYYITDNKAVRFRRVAWTKLTVAMVLVIALSDWLKTFFCSEVPLMAKQSKARDMLHFWIL